MGYSPEKLNKFELSPVKVTKESIVRGNSCEGSCPIALSIKEELPPKWKVAVSRLNISIFDEQMYEKEFVNTGFVTDWICNFDEFYRSKMRMSIEPLNRNLLLKCLPFNIRLTLQPDEDGHLERWAMGY